MKRFLPASLYVIATALVLAWIVAGVPSPEAELASGQGASLVSGGPQEGGGSGGDAILERVEPPVGPFDPVLVQPAERGRFGPPANSRVNNRAGDTSVSVQSEVGIWVDGDDVVVGWNDAMGFNGSGTLTGYGYSTDRGNTWTDGGSLPNTGGTNPFGDPTVVRTNSGFWLIASIDQGSPQGVSIHRGTLGPGGITWQTPVKVVDGGAFLDKEYLDYDPVTNTVYLSYTNFGSYSIRVRRSTDDGATWSSPVIIGNSGNGAYPAVGIDGEVYVSWLDPLGSPNANARIRWSPDGGATFPEPTRTVDTMGPSSNQAPTCFNRNFNTPFPSCDVDRSNGPNRGRVYAVWSDGARNTYDIFFSYSDDKARNWSAPVRLNDNDNFSNTESFWPQIRVSETDGRILVGWYDRRNSSGGNSLCDYYAVMSVDGGETWGPNRRMSDMSVAWCGVPSDISPNFGDYTDVTIDDRSVFTAWSDGRDGDPDVIFSRFDDRHLLAVAGEVGTRTPVSGDGTAWFFTNDARTTLSPEAAFAGKAEMAVAAVGLGLMASPQEGDAAFVQGGEALSGTVDLTSSEGSVAGTIDISRTSPSEISFQFTAESEAGLAAIDFQRDWTAELLVLPGAGQTYALSGTVTMGRFLGTPVEFQVSGTLVHVGDPLIAAQILNQEVSTTGGLQATLHTRTIVTEDATVDVPEPLVLGDNPFPSITVGATPNPYEAGSRIRYRADRDAEGSIRIFAADGRLVRTIAEGRFEAGEHYYTFDGKDSAGRDLAAGGYFIRFQTQYLSANAKMFVVR